MSDITKTRYTEEYKQYRRDYMKAYRKRNKTLNDTPHNPRWKKKGTRTFSDNTKKQYINIILRIHEKLQINIQKKRSTDYLVIKRLPMILPSISRSS